MDSSNWPQYLSHLYWNPDIDFVAARLTDTRTLALAENMIRCSKSDHQITYGTESTLKAMSFAYFAANPPQSIRISGRRNVIESAGLHESRRCFASICGQREEGNYPAPAKNETLRSSLA